MQSVLLLSKHHISDTVLGSRDAKIQFVIKRTQFIVEWYIYVQSIMSSVKV